MIFVMPVPQLNTVAGKIRRAAGYANAAAMQGASGLFARSFARDALRRAFARNLVSLRGVPMKLAQIRSMSESDGGPLYREALAGLPQAPAAAMRSHLESIAPGIAASIASFDPAGIPASLGQAHRVRMRDGRDCALKIRYPGIAAGVELDVATLNVMLGMFKGFGAGFSLDAYREMFARELAAEMD